MARASTLRTPSLWGIDLQGPHKPTQWKVDCWNCGGSGEIEGACTCGEDCCCCLDPESPPCGECEGKGVLIVTELTDDNRDNAVRIEA